MSIGQDAQIESAREVSLVVGELMATTRELRTLARELLGEGRSDALEARTDSIDGALRRMLTSLEAAGANEPLPEMCDCPKCGRSVRVGATLCGYCWRKLD